MSSYARANQSDFSPRDPLLRIQYLAEALASYGRVQKEDSVLLKQRSLELPIYSFSFGSEDAKAPVLAFIAGVHGLEVVGIQVLLAFLETLKELLAWDTVIHDQLKHLRLCFYPCVNPGGLTQGTRSNPDGIDLMRNAPVDSKDVSWFSLPAGHRISARLPWYRGPKNGNLAAEAETLCHFVKRECWPSPFSLVLDMHSGFGVIDRLWFPFAHTLKPFPRVAQVYAMKELLDRTFPHHIYSVEPQSVQYLAHGDLWDYLFLEHQKTEFEPQIFLPLCLELGSWGWVKKNPRQLFHLLGMFNPIIPHRYHRTMRRHHILLDFLLRATISYRQWAVLAEENERRNALAAHQLWYR